MKILKTYPVMINGVLLGKVFEELQFYVHLKFC